MTFDAANSKTTSKFHSASINSYQKTSSKNNKDRQYIPVFFSENLLGKCLTIFYWEDSFPDINVIMYRLKPTAQNSIGDTISGINVLTFHNVIYILEV